ncbi:glycosyltransferase [Hyphomicrobium sp. CS1GBMeth3]|uniref:glycosyltransferase n=1 Tax=Hyphomicrobium sp. CS1GBMeth3 TaxID=1892845 RepID=UPI0011147EDB|nr:glycosyltransferase [Hyphomicrobium sp. CS1GBMeth3]
MLKYSAADVETIRKSGLFDENWYLRQYPDVTHLGMNPIEHYLWLGWVLGRDPSPTFSTRYYLDVNPDVARQKLNPLLHYARVGKSENRTCRPSTERTDCKRIIERYVPKWDTTREAELLASLERASVNTAPTKVSIIMPTRNRGGCIGRAIKSILEQSHDNWELIVVDDGSDDDTSERVRSFQDDRIKYHRHDKGRGVSAARNTALKHIGGDWVFFLDSDNTWRPQHIERLLRFASSRDLSAAYCAANLIDDAGKTRAVLFSEFDFESCLELNFIDLNTFCVKSSLARIGFDESLRRLVDWDYILRIAAQTRVQGARFIGVDYYDGTNLPRITNTEYVTKPDLNKSMEYIRDRARSTLMSSSRPARSNAKPQIAVVFHVYHKNIAPDCLQYVDNIPHEYDLFITTSHPGDDPEIEALRRAHPRATVFRFPNTGADIGPFLSLTSTLCNYDLVCKVHTKRNVGKWGNLWRDYFLYSMLGSEHISDQIIDAFRTDPDLCLAGPAEFFKEGRRNSVAPTWEQVKKFAIACGHEQDINKTWGFFAGTMLWLRPAILLKLARHVYDTPSYNTVFQSDGAPEHGLERMIGLAAMQNPNAKVALASVQADGAIDLSVVPPTKSALEGVSQTLDRLLPRKLDLSPKLPRAQRTTVSRAASAPWSMRIPALTEVSLKISTIIPTYNQEEYIGGAIESALKQRGNFVHEILVANDGSTDGTQAVIDSYCRQYPDIVRSIGGDDNIGISKNFWRSFDAASGSFVAVLEGDDYWTADDKLQAQSEFLISNPDCSMVFSMIEVHDIQRDTRKVLERQAALKKSKLDGSDFLADPNMNLIANFSCCMFRSGLIKTLPTVLFEKRLNEIALAFHLDRYGKIGFINRVMSVYRQHPQGVWTGSDRRAQLSSGLEARKTACALARDEYKGAIRSVIEQKFITPLAQMESRESNGSPRSDQSHASTLS